MVKAWGKWHHAALANHTLLDRADAWGGGCGVHVALDDLAGFRVERLSGLEAQLLAILLHDEGYALPIDRADLHLAIAAAFLQWLVIDPDRALAAVAALDITLDAKLLGR